MQLVLRLPPKPVGHYPICAYKLLLIGPKKAPMGGGSIGAQFGHKGRRNHQGGCGFSSNPKAVR